MLEALQRRFPTLATPRKEDICYATQNRQDAVKKLVAACDVMVVVGSATSSNSNRLREIAEKAGMPGYLVDGPEDLRPEWFEGKSTVGVTAGASAPELLVQRVVARLREWGGQGAAEVEGRAENVVFALPRELRPAATQGRRRPALTAAVHAPSTPVISVTSSRSPSQWRCRRRPA